MGFKPIRILTVVFLLFLASCSNPGLFQSCPDGDISWVDALMINDIKYEGDDEGLSVGEPKENGDKVGEVSYQLAGNACSNHQLQNGDAAFLPVGTEIYELIGYDPSFRVIADDQVFQVKVNDAAKTLGELYDIDGKVEKVSLESDYDGSHILDFSNEDSEQFVVELLSLDYLGYSQVYQDINSDYRVFLRIHLDDGSSFRLVYWPDENVLNAGAYGTEKVKEIVQSYTD